MQNFPNSATMQSRLAVLKSRFQTFQEEQNHQLQYQEILEENADEAAPVEYEVLYSDEYGNVSVVEPTAKDQPESTFPTNAKPAQWTRPAIHYLIGFYKHIARSESLGRTSFGPIAIWTEVSKKLLQRGYTCTPEQCRTKWLLLKKLYQHISNESQIQKFDFLEAMHEYLKNERVENILQEMKRKAKDEPTALGRGIKRKRIKEEIEREEEDYNSDMTLEKDSSTRTLSNNEVQAIMDIMQENDDVFAEMEDHLTDQSAYCTVASEEVAQAQDTNEEYNIVIEPHEEESPSLYEELTPIEEQPAITSSSQLTNDTQHVTKENYFKQIKDLFELQEQRRIERHNAKLQMFREYNERLLSQQEAAIALHKKLMERLIDSL